MAAAPKNKKDVLTFEQSVARLDEIVQRVDAPDTGLEEMIALVEEGLKLIRSSREMLDKAELRITMLENESVPQPTEHTQETKQSDHGFSLF